MAKDRNGIRVGPMLVPCRSHGGPMAARRGTNKGPEWDPCRSHGSPMWTGHHVSAITVLQAYQEFLHGNLFSMEVRLGTLSPWTPSRYLHGDLRGTSMEPPLGTSHGAFNADNVDVDVNVNVIVDADAISL